MPEGKVAPLRLRRSLVDPRLAPKPAHHFVWTRVVSDVALEVGHFDLPEVRAALERSRTAAAATGSDPGAELTMFVTDRFVMTTQGISSFLNAADELKRDLEKQGMWPPLQPVAPGRVN